MNNNGNPACYETQGPCGKFNKPGPPVAVYPGSVNVVINKNLNHFWPQNPGNFSVFLWKGNTAVRIATFPDTNESTDPQTYMLNVKVPEHPRQVSYVLQAVYFTNNPNEGNFYQCSDIAIGPSGNSTAVE
jgi:hypothetical protein